MNKDFVTFNLAKKLKEKGFYYKCVSTYDNDGMFGYNYIQPTSIRAIGFDDCLCSHNVENDGCIDAPAISQVLKWLRNEKKIHVCIDLYAGNWEYTIKENISLNESCGFIWQSCPVPICNGTSYEDAALDGIEYVLDNLI